MPQFRKASEYKLDGDGGGVAPPPAAGHNSQAEKNREVLFFMDLGAYNKALASKKAADAEMKRVGKVIKADLGDHGLKSIKTFIKAQSEEGSAELRAEAEAIAQAMRYAGTPSGYQFDLLEDRTPLVERAALDGRRSGLLGETLNNPYNEGSAEGQAYATGWHEGQADLFAGITARKEQEAEAELIEGPAHDEGGDLDDGDGE